MITATVPFPPISWWAKAIKAEAIKFDLQESYQKMTYRNRYYLASPNGKQLMSLPLESGRNQRLPVADVKLFNASGWQSNHWKTITSLYRRSPFFEYYEHLLQPLFENGYEYLHQFNIAGIKLINQILGLQLSFAETEAFVKNYPEQILDVRNIMLPKEEGKNGSAEYYQVFAERTGFVSDCSILDLLFCEGNYANEILLKTV